jgi:hypothetical protein
MRESPSDAARSAARGSYIHLRRSSAALLMASALALLFTDAVLLQQNVRLRGFARAYFLLIGPPFGKRLPAVSGTDLAGRRVTVAYGRREPRTLLLAFSPTCGVCNLTWPAWQNLIKAAGQESVRVVFLNVGPKLDSKYACSHGISGGLVIAKPDPDVLTDYNLRLTPDTVLLSPGGMIQDAWIGALNSARLGAAESALRTPFDPFKGGEQ